MKLRKLRNRDLQVLERPIMLLKTLRTRTGAEGKGGLDQGAEKRKFGRVWAGNRRKAGVVHGVFKRGEVALSQQQSQSWKQQRTKKV